MMCPTCLLFATLAVSLSAACGWCAYRRGLRSRGPRGRNASYDLGFRDAKAMIRMEADRLRPPPF